MLLENLFLWREPKYNACIWLTFIWQYVFLPFCIGPWKNDQLLLLSIYIICSLPRTAFSVPKDSIICSFPSLFSHLKMIPGCRKIRVFTLEVRFLVLMALNPHDRDGTQQNPYIFWVFPAGQLTPWFIWSKGQFKGSFRGFFRLPKIFSRGQCDYDKSNFHTESKPHFAVKSQDIFN